MKTTVSLALLLLASVVVLRVMEPNATPTVMAERERDVKRVEQGRPERAPCFLPTASVSAQRARFRKSRSKGDTRNASRNRQKAAVSQPSAEAEPVEFVETVDRAADLAQTATRLLNADAYEVAVTVAGLPDLKEQRMLIRNLVAQKTGDGGIPDRAWIGQLADRKLQAFAAETVAREWGRSDLDAVWSWIEQTPDPELQAAAVSGAVWNLAQLDFDATTEWIGGMEPSKLRDAAALKAAKIYALDRPQEAVAWAAEFPEGELRDSALSYGLHQWTATSLLDAADWAIGLSDEKLQAKALPMIAAAWAGSDPVAATEWVSAFPADLRQPALEETTRRWLNRDPETAAAWFAQNGFDEAGTPPL